MKRILFILIAIMAILVGFYPLLYLFAESRFGLLNSKTETLLNNYAWKAGFYAHIVPGGIAMLLVWMQFVDRWRLRHPRFHRNAGKFYVLAALTPSLAAIRITYFSTGGVIPATGFMLLGIVWLLTTVKAYSSIRKYRIEEHRRMMIYSYAACLSAVTLRIYLPALIVLFDDFIVAYSIVAWLCWIPNLLIAYMLIKHGGNIDEDAVKSSIELPDDEPSVATQAP